MQFSINEDMALSINTQVFRSYMYYVGVLVLKMMAMTLLTIYQRLRNNALVSEEDAAFLGGKVCHTNPKVERVRKSHRNDLESILIFMIIAFGFMFTEPDPATAEWLFFIFAVCRIIHTIAYAVLVIPQPVRGLSWLVGFLITGHMALRTCNYFSN